MNYIYIYIYNTTDINPGANARVNSRIQEHTSTHTHTHTNITEVNISLIYGKKYLGFDRNADKLTSRGKIKSYSLAQCKSQNLGIHPQQTSLIVPNNSMTFSQFPLEEEDIKINSINKSSCRTISACLTQREIYFIKMNINVFDKDKNRHWCLWIEISYQELVKKESKVQEVE